MTPLEWLSSTRDLDLDLGSGHTAYRRSSVIELYLPNFIEVGKKLFVDGQTLQTPSSVIRSTRRSRPKDNNEDVQMRC